MSAMEYVKLGRTGLDVSRLCLGCMSFGIPDRGAHPWTLDEEKSRPFIKRALEAGINFFDTANIYSDGTSEEIVGRALRDFARRDEVVVATKVCYRDAARARTRRGLSRKIIMTAIDDSLRRLGTDYVDLYQIHRWDTHTPIEETLEALHDVVKAGQGALHRRVVDVRLAVLQGAVRGRPARLDALRVDAEPLQPALPRGGARDDAAVRGRGRRRCCPGARSRAAASRATGTTRPSAASTDEFGRTLYASHVESDRRIVERVRDGRGGARRPARAGRAGLDAVEARRDVADRRLLEAAHLTDALAALALRLTPEEIASLEEPYVPHPVVGFQ